MKTSSKRLYRDLHFDLRWLGPVHETDDFTLRLGGRRRRMQRHTPESLAALQPKGSPTHYAAGVETDPAVVCLARVTGSNTDDGFPTLAAVAIVTPSDSASYSAEDVAKAVVFMNPGISVLTPDLAQTVLSHIGASDSLSELQLVITSLGTSWATPQPLPDADGVMRRRVDGTPQYTYELDPEVLNTSAQPSGQSRALIYSDASLQGPRWNLLPGVSSLDMNAQNAAAAKRRAAGRPRGNSGYSVNLQDGGPNFGLSVTVNGLSQDLVLDLTVTNSYIRHTSVFVSFMKADGVTPMQVPDNIWTALVKGAAALIVKEWLGIAESSAGQELLALLESSDNTLKWIGNVSSESTFLGVPVSDSNIAFQFALPSDQGPVGKIRLLVGSLGVDSGNDWDPTAAWLGLSMTALIDLAIPTYALISTVGEESNTLFDSIFKDAPFLLSTAYQVFLVAENLFTGSPNTGNNISSAIASLGSSIASKVLTASDVAAKLAAYFGAEEAEEAIPFVGWGLKVMAMEATIVQLAQTIGEVIGSPRVVEFDLTVTMNAQITLVPDPSTGGEFPATATSYAITAQYSGNTTRTYTGSIDDPKVSQIVVDWEEVPVGGTVSFVVALFSKEGWGVGKGQSGSFDNMVNATDPNNNPIFAASVDVAQELYPLSADTTYQHSQLLGYSESGGYQWQQTSEAPTETAQDLGTGPRGSVLEALTAITLSDDLGVLGYGWEATGLNIQPVGGGSTKTELYTMQNIGYKPIAGDSDPAWPQAGYMSAPEGYSKPALLLYLRSAQGPGPDAAGPGFFYLDPSGDATDGFHLRQVTPVTDPSVPMDDPSRQFDLSTGSSWGRFALLPTSLAIHSNGYVVAVNPANDTLQILQLPSAASADADAPWAWIPAGPGTAPGRLDAPALVAIRPDQTILVLEAGNQRIQAFSRGGHPVPAFPNSATPYWIPLVPHAPSGTSTVYLSMSVDVANYTYVLSQLGNGFDASDFYLDVYTPTGAALFSQQGLNAGGLAVDLWRNVYTLNFQQIAGLGGRPEPSISEYIPSTPSAETDNDPDAEQEPK